MLNLRLFLGALGLGLLGASLHCLADAASATVAVSAVLLDTALLGALFGLVFVAVAVCCDHRTVNERRTAERHKRALQRSRNRRELDLARARSRSRNRF